MCWLVALEKGLANLQHHQLGCGHPLVGGLVDKEEHLRHSARTVILHYGQSLEFAG